MPRQQQPEKRPIVVDRIKRCTHLAVLVVLNGADKWIPKSQLHEPDEIEPTDERTELYVSPWYIKTAGLE